MPNKVFPESPVHPSQHVDVVTFGMESASAGIPLEATAYVVGIWRAALMSRSDQPVPEIISGHPDRSTVEKPSASRRSHLALFPIPDLASFAAPPTILGLGAAIPLFASEPERMACLRALSRVSRLTLGGLGVWHLRPTNERDAPPGLRVSTWGRSAREWASVTPVVLGKYPREPFGAESRTVLRVSCDIAGLPGPDEIQVSRSSWFHGVPPSSRFPARKGRPGRPPRFHVHVRVTFPHEVQGPVLLGAERHLGYGLLAQARAPRAAPESTSGLS